MSESSAREVSNQRAAYSPESGTTSSIRLWRSRESVSIKQRRRGPRQAYRRTDRPLLGLADGDVGGEVGHGDGATEGAEKKKRAPSPTVNEDEGPDEGKNGFHDSKDAFEGASKSVRCTLVQEKEKETRRPPAVGGPTSELVEQLTSSEERSVSASNAKRLENGGRVVWRRKASQRSAETRRRPEGDWKFTYS